MSHLHIGHRYATNKKRQMFSALSASFKSSILKEFDTLLDARIQGVIESTLKKVADDYKLSYGELKTRYTLTPVKTVTVDLEDSVSVDESAEPITTFKETPAVALAVPVAPDAPEQLPMSKMKKRDLELECERRGLCPDGTISELKERVKQARLLEKPVKKARKPKDPNAPKKERKPKDPNAPKKVPKVKEAVPAPPPAPVVVPLEEDEEFYPCKPCVVPEPEDREEPEEELGLEDEDLEDEDDSMKARLRKILQDAGELDEDEEFEDEE